MSWRTKDARDNVSTHYFIFPSFQLSKMGRSTGGEWDIVSPKRIGGFHHLANRISTPGLHRDQL